MRLYQKYSDYFSDDSKNKSFIFLIVLPEIKKAIIIYKTV